MEFNKKFQSFLEGIDFDEERFVPAVGPEEASVVLVGEAPGANEVEQGEPFVGRAGDRLDETLREIGVDRSSVYITNLVKVRPPDNRDPKKDEIEKWAPLLEKEIEKVNPDMVLTLGNFASREMLDTSKGISEIHGKVFQRNGRKIMPVYHPAATLYDRSKAPELENDLRKAFGKENAGQNTLEDF